MRFAAALGVAASMVVAPGAQAAEPIACREAVNVFTVRADGSLWRFGHEEPERGASVWNGPDRVGSDWARGAFAGPGNRFYDVKPNGDLWRFRLTAGGWEDGGTGRRIGTGWHEQADPAARNRVTVDQLGHFYAFDKLGVLRMRTYDESTGAWTSTVLDTGWDRYDMVVAAGEGVLYARKFDGTLVRYLYHHASRRLVHNAVQVGTGWQVYSRIFSPGGDVVYGVRADTGELVWHRFEAVGGSFDASKGQAVGTGWQRDLTTIASTDDCKLTDDVYSPNRTAVPARPEARPALFRIADGRLRYDYADGTRGLVVGTIGNIQTGADSKLTRFPLVKAADTPSIAQTGDGTVWAAAHALDGDSLSYDASGTVTSLGGWTHTSPKLVRTADGLLTAVALAADGGVWTRRQAEVNGPLLAWKRALGAGQGATRELTAVAVGNEVKIVVLSTDGGYYTGTLGDPDITWTSNGGTDGASAAAVIVRPEGLQLFVRRTDNSLHMWRAGVWTRLDGGVAGAPDALISSYGRAHVVVRGTDGNLHQAFEMVEGHPEFGKLHQISEKDGSPVATGSDPAVSLAGDTWAIAYRTADGKPALRRALPKDPDGAEPGPWSGGAFAVVPVPEP